MSISFFGHAFLGRRGNWKVYSAAGDRAVWQLEILGISWHSTPQCDCFCRNLQKLRQQILWGAWLLGRLMVNRLGILLARQVVNPLLEVLRHMARLFNLPTTTLFAVLVIVVRNTKTPSILSSCPTQLYFFTVNVTLVNLDHDLARLRYNFHWLVALEERLRLPHAL